jgi:hypothetical protein
MQSPRRHAFGLDYRPSFEPLARKRTSQDTRMDAPPGQSRTAASEGGVMLDNKKNRRGRERPSVGARG